MFTVKDEGTDFQFGGNPMTHQEILYVEKPQNHT